MDEIIAIDISDDEVESALAHYGVKRRSGRYPWGSGENPYQHSGDFISRVNAYKKEGMTEKEIANAMRFKSTTDYRRAYTIATNQRRSLLYDEAKSLKSDGLSVSEIGRRMGLNESSVRSLLNEKSAHRMQAYEETANKLREELTEKLKNNPGAGLDVGTDVERELGVSRNVLDTAIARLQYEGYNVYNIAIQQPTSKMGNRTTIKVLAEPTDDTKSQFVSFYKDPQLIEAVGEYTSTDGGVSWDHREYPSSVDSSRIKVRYGDEGGVGKDGVIELRRGVADLDLGNSHYAQVRILVDGTHYLKGMAMYSDDMPDGVDIVFNTNKKSGKALLGYDDDGTPNDSGVLKPIKSDPDNPFGAYIKANGQSYYDDPNGKYTNAETGKKQSLSAINKLKEEGDWDTQSKSLSSQFLSKQPMELINRQLKLTYTDAVDEFEEIKSITNPVIRQSQLLEFASSCDSAVVHLKAAALPRQQTRVLLPVTQLKDNEVYAPYLKDGEKVCLVRYPHGGTFEIPELTVNNKNSSAKKILGNATDAIGINMKVAERLSGADFDGDTAIVIPVNSKVKVKTSKPLADLVGFDPKTEYAYHEGMKVLTKKATKNEMGKVSNLITDMTLAGAEESEIARAVKHSMVVIDAAKHKLDYKQSEKDQGIAELKKKYQARYDDDGNLISTGASTLISRHKHTVQIDETKGAGRIDPDTGEVTYKTSGRTYIDKKGNKVAAKKDVYLLNQTEDLRTLSSGTEQEEAYAAYGNQMKALANAARKEYANTKTTARSASAAKTYAEEVASLDAKLDRAARNAPKERRATVIANSVIKAKIQANPELADKENKKDLQKVKRLAMDDARSKVGASSQKSKIEITDREWEAIQAGAISASKLKQIVRYTDSDKLKQRALPKVTTTLSSARVAKIKQMQISGYTIAEIAESVGCSTSTVSKYLRS